jgi:hypothetical protein
MNFYPFADIETISPRPLLFITGDKAHSREFSEEAYRLAAEPKELLIVPGAGHVDLYDRVPVIPFDRLTAFFTEHLKAEFTPVTHAKQENAMRVSIKTQDTTLTATLIDSETSRDFVSLLPLTLTLDDYNKTDKISDLPKKLTSKGAPAGAKPFAGDIAYYTPWGNFALFYKDFGYSEGLIILGKLDSGVETLNGRSPTKVTIELVGNDYRK